MFDRRRQVLLRDGARAHAVVTDVRLSGGHVSDEGATALRFRLELRVHFADGSTSDTSCQVGSRFRSASAFFFSPGDIVPVRYDPADTSNLVVDEPEWLARREDQRRADAEAAILDAERRLAGPPGVDTTPTPPLPTDEKMQAAYRAWRTAVSRAKQSKAAHKRAQAGGDRRETLQLFNQSVTRTAEEKSARAKYNALRNLRPDWTVPVQDGEHEL